jgi:tetratricopeptide (TPR) repeat protein
MGEYDKALLDALHSIKIDSNYLRGYYRAAYAFYEKGEYNSALEILDKSNKVIGDKELTALRDKINNKKIVRDTLINSIFYVIRIRKLLKIYRFL